MALPSNSLQGLAETLGDRVSDTELQAMISAADVDQDGLVGPEDFLQVFRDYKL